MRRRLVVTEVSGQHIGPIFKEQAVFDWYCSTIDEKPAGFI